MAVYIGDGCYAEFDGFAIVLTTSNGLKDTNRIVLEPEVFDALVNYRSLMTRPAPSDSKE